MSQMIATEGDIVSSFLTRSVGSKNTNEKIIIIHKSRPIQELEIKAKGRVFQNDWYIRKDSLCGSEGKKYLFCWPCLLFCPGFSHLWTGTGYCNMQLCDCKKHEKANSHTGNI